MMNLFDELEDRNRILANEISNAESVHNDALAIELKKELYSNKIQMLNILTAKEKRAGITARELKKEVDSKPKIPRYATGIESLDYKLFGGIEIGTFVQLAGESGVGKTHLQLEILSNIAKYGKSVFFNFEMGDTRIVKRLEKLLTSDEQWDNLIIDSDSRNIDEICNEITLYAKSGIKFFTIDSKMKIDTTESMQDYQKFSAISKKLAELSQKQEVIIFLINQMNEDDIKNKRLAFKGSGDQKYDSDLAFFYVKDEDGNRKLICNKNRQDEKEFTLNLFLDENYRTQSNDYEIVYKDKNNRVIAKPTITEFVADDTISMSML